MRRHDLDHGCDPDPDPDHDPDRDPADPNLERDRLVVPVALGLRLAP